MQDYYIGPAFNISDCEGLIGAGSPPCTNGSITGSVTFDGSATGYTGTLTAAHVVSYFLSASNVASISGLSYLNTSSLFGLSNGQMTGVSWQAYDLEGPGPDDKGIYVYSYGAGPNDSAYQRNSGVVQAYGFEDHSVVGIWLNPKSFGLACGKPGAASCGEPIDLGSGNMFYQATDYQTAGQNPLAFTRYYNSMAVPDTSAVAMGSNWRTIYDRYLHIFRARSAG